MRIEKIKKSYNDYKVEMSFGQLQAIKAALERDHADPVTDELYAELVWYLDHIPGPGEEEEDLKMRDEMSQMSAEGGTEGDGGEESDQGDYPLPMPPGHDKPGMDDGGPGADEGPDLSPPGDNEGGGASGPPPAGPETDVPDDPSFTESVRPVPGDLEEDGLPQPPTD